MLRRPMANMLRTRSSSFSRMRSGWRCRTTRSARVDKEGLFTYADAPKWMFSCSQMTLRGTDSRRSSQTTAMAIPSPQTLSSPAHVSIPLSPLQQLANNCAQSTQSTFKLKEWFSKHGPEQTRPPLDAVIVALRKEGVTLFGATGYCFGGRYSVDLALEGVTKAIAIAHPSLLQVPGDFEVRSNASPTLQVLMDCNINRQCWQSRRVRYLSTVARRISSSRQRNRRSRTSCLAVASTRLGTNACIGTGALTGSLCVVIWCAC